MVLRTAPLLVALAGATVQLAMVLDGHRAVAGWLVWYSGFPILLGITAALFDVLVLLDHKKPDVPVRYIPVARRRVTVALTAYNDEESIGPAVQDFLSHPLVERVIVVSNNSSDRTFERARQAGPLQRLC